MANRASMRGTTGPTRPPARARGEAGRLAVWLVVGALVAVLAVGAGVWYFVFRDTAPAKVDIETAAEAARNDQSSSTTTNGAATTTKNLDGTWKVNNEIGDFNVSTDTFTSSWVGYRVKEELSGIGAKTAAGRTPDVTGSLTIDGTTATAATFTAQLTTLQSDDTRRDGQLRNQALQTSQFPTATFTLTKPIAFGTVPADESTVKVDATGDLTLHGVTKSVTIPLQAKVVGDTVVVTSLFDITFADFSIRKPQSVIVLSVEDKGQMELQLFFTKS